MASSPRVIVAPDSFKGTLSARQAAEAIAAGVRQARHDAVVQMIPMADGGEGTLDVLVDAAHGNRRIVPAHGPLGDPIDVTVGLIDQASTAVVEMARVSGFTLIPSERRNPLITSTFGLGEVIRAVIESEIEEIILAIGGSATVEGGAGMMQALGMTLLDAGGRVIQAPIGGGDLHRVVRIVWDKPPANIEHVRITIACDVLNPALGPNGAAAIFGPQKGADAQGVAILEKGLSKWTELLESFCRRPIRNEPGSGAAGAVALPLLALTNASLMPGVDLVCQANGLAGHLANADLVLTGEGRLDRQSLMGKVVGAVARLARTAEVPCIALVGMTGEGAEECMHVLDGYFPLPKGEGDGLADSAARLTALAKKIAQEML